MSRRGAGAAAAALLLACSGGAPVADEGTVTPSAPVDTSTTSPEPLPLERVAVGAIPIAETGGCVVVAIFENPNRDVAARTRVRVHLTDVIGVGFDTVELAIDAVAPRSSGAATFGLPYCPVGGEVSVRGSPATTFTPALPEVGVTATRVSFADGSVKGSVHSDFTDTVRVAVDAVFRDEHGKIVGHTFTQVVVAPDETVDFATLPDLLLSSGPLVGRPEVFLGVPLHAYES